MSAGSPADDSSAVRAEVNYVRNPPASGGAPLEFVPDAEERSTMQTLPGRSVRIENARGLPTHLDREGFVLVPHTSSIADFDRVQAEPAVDQRYIAEMTELLAQVTGASRVIFLGGAKQRYGESATEQLARLSNAKPARYPHADNTDASAAKLAGIMAQHMHEVELEACPRYALYNLWRATTPPPQDFPLAVCDARSVAPEDEVTVTALTVEQGGVHIRHDTTSYLYNPAHRWYYYKDMTPAEVLVFKAHDTDRQRAVRVPHTAFTDPGCPPGTPTRASVETRALALFD